jgi:hypothetical protein
MVGFVEAGLMKDDGWKSMPPQTVAAQQSASVCIQVMLLIYLLRLMNVNI